MTEQELVKLIENAAREKETTLDLSNHALISLPQKIGQLTHLTELYLCGNALYELPPEIGQLTNLKDLKLDNNLLYKLPAEIGQLTNLTKLSLMANNLSEIPEEIGKLTNLTRLDLCSNQLRKVPANIGRLTNLTLLDISNCHLSEIPVEICQLTNLSGLLLWGNKLSKLPMEICQLINLTSLDLSRNNLSDFPTEICQLTKLVQLDTMLNQLTDLPKEIGQLTNLVSLDFRDNKLQYLPEEICKLTNLSELFLSDNKLRELPVGICQLSNLRKLFFGSNQLRKLPPEIGQLTNMVSLDLHDNQLSELPTEISHLIRLSRLFLHRNPGLGIPFEMLGTSIQDAGRNYGTPAKPAEILDYYFRTRAGKKPLNEAKLILVGYGNVGKTSLVERLVHGRFDKYEQKTEGIEITDWPIELHNGDEVRLNVWDFGGQEIMHATHQFFLTPRSLYLLVLNGRQGHEDEDTEYWLNLIQSFGKDAPVIVVLNKINEHQFDLNRGELRQKYPGIRAFIETDCEDPTVGIDVLRETVLRETDRLEHLRDAFPAAWFDIKDTLSDMDDDYVSFDRYRQICADHGESTTTGQDFLAGHLHALGIALNYREDHRLRDTNVLNPRWVTEGIYDILTSEKLAKRKGILSVNEAGTVLDTQRYPCERHAFLFELMRKFDLCFSFSDDDGHYLIPELLDKQQPTEAEVFDPAACLNFHYEYPILPEGILPRFIVRTNVLSKKGARWRSGVILNFEGNTALVKADSRERRVSITVSGPPAGRRRLLAVIRSDFERIHGSFDFEPKEMVSVPKHPQVAIPYNDLKALENAGRSTHATVVDGEVIDLNVSELLNGVDLKGKTMKPHTTGEADPLRLFYSYSHKDETLRDELETHLKLLERQKIICPWHDRRISAGKEFANEIDENLERADIILLLVSANFIASDYCYDIEMKRAIERHNTGEARVIPVILRDVDWHTAPFGKLNALPKDGMAVTLWDNKDSAWRNVAEGIKKAAEELRNAKP